jgi:hypothetical protein
MQHRRRSKRIAALNTSSSISLTGSILVKGQKSSSKCVQTLSGNQKNRNFEELEFGAEEVAFSSPQLLHVKKSVSFSPSSIVVDGVGIRTETPLAKPQTCQDNGGILHNNTPQRRNLRKVKDVVFGETLTAAEVAAMTGTENCLMDDDVFERDDTDTVTDETECTARRYRYQDSFCVADYTIHDDYIMSTQSWLALIFILVASSFFLFTFGKS